MTTLEDGKGGCCCVLGVGFELIMEEFLASGKARPKRDTLGCELLTVFADPLTESMSPAMRGGGLDPPLGCREDGGETKLLGNGRLGMGPPKLPMVEAVPWVAVTGVPR